MDRAKIYFHIGPFLLPWPYRVDPGGSLKPGPAPQWFRMGPDFQTGPCLINAGTTMTRGHDVDTLDWATQHVAARLPVDPLHLHMTTT